MQNGDDNSSNEFEDEARDAVWSLKSKGITRTRSMSPNQFSSRRRRMLLEKKRKKSSLAEENEEDDDVAHDGPRHLEDLPQLELEGAPAGWNASRAGRSREQAPPVTAMNKGRRSSAFPISGMSSLDVRRPSVGGQRRASQMTFDEWVHLKKFQEMQEAANTARRNSKDVIKNHKTNMKHNISYEEWSKQTEERKKRDLEEHEKLRMQFLEEREAAEKAKFKKKMSFDQWKKIKEAAKDGKLKQENGEQTLEGGTEEERKKKSEEAHRKWMIKKELEEIKRDRDMLLRMQNANLTINAPNVPAGSSGNRRTSWIDANAALKVAANRG
uniref:vicilin-like seed storage protein At2g18540 n=1 Tax=Styela clava TaxID=7725 RepID=UPI001939E3D7|nr:vicilin-like seed storage protein At2g18540 [Styela clava]